MSSDAVPSTAAANLSVVQQLYTAFGRGDIPAVLELVSEDIAWEQWDDSFAQRADVPWMRPRTGQAGVAEFFSIVGTFEITEFSVVDLLASERRVAAQVVIGVSLPDGGRYRDEELHVWTFDAAGKIVGLRHYVDTAKQIAAAGGADTTAGS
jgi:ketosteroid isomerase-like protein